MDNIKMEALPWARMTQFHACDKIRGDDLSIDIENSFEERRKEQQIEKVPSMLRNRVSNKNCYDPLIVSIGPYHHENKDLKAGETLKITFANKFRRACGDQVSFKQLYEEVMKVAEDARKFYEEGSTEKYDNVSFAKMMLLDACFVLQFMCVLTNNETEIEDQLLTMKSHISAFVWRDLFLLENQIPLLVLRVLANLRLKNKSLIDLIQEFLELSTITSMPGEGRPYLVQFDKSPHLLELMWIHVTGQSPNNKGTLAPPTAPETFYSCRTATELEAVGIYFEASKTRHVTDVEFIDHHVHGTITLPPLVVDDSTKPLLLNLVAYEMSPNGPSGSPISSYIWLMDSFIDHVNDVRLLRNKRIIFNSLSSDELLVKLFNDIAADLVPDLRANEDVMFEIDRHWRKNCRVWIAEWKRNNFRSPWAFLAFLGAIFAIVLTMVQTYFSVFPRSK